MSKKFVALLLLCLVPLVWHSVSAAPTGGDIPTYIPAVMQGVNIPAGNVAMVTRNMQTHADLFLVTPDGTLSVLKRNIVPHTYPEFSPDGQYFTLDSDSSDTNSNTYIAPISNPDRLIPLLDPQGVYPRWLSDSMSLAYNGNYQSGGEPGIFVITLPNVQTERITSDLVWQSVWSPNADMVVYSAAENDEMDKDIYRIQRDGSRKVALYTAPTDDYVRHVLRDERILFEARTELGSTIAGDLYLMNGDGSNVRQLTNSSFAESAPSLSQQENQILYISDVNRATLMDLQSNVKFEFPVPCSDNRCYFNEVAWRPAASEVFFVLFVPAGNDFTLMRIRTDGSEATPRTLRETVQSMDITADGNYLGYEADISGSHRGFIRNLNTDIETVIPIDNWMRFMGWRFSGQSSQP